MTLAAAALAFLALTGDGRSGQHSASYSVPAMIAFESALVGVGAALLLSYRTRGAEHRRGVMLAMAAGLLFTVTHVAVKAVSGKLDAGVLELVFNPYLLLAAAGGVVAFFASARSLQIGPAVPVIAVTAIAGNTSAIPAGILVFGDPLGGDARVVAVRTVAFVLVVVAAALIPAPTRAAETPAEREKPAPAPRRPVGVAA